ncbi:hypothetical protein AEGHOMDF_4544 [Methylobacterium soli]|nr:hypothetical protein AEGHOMDF_4544 [Methylobacterium soli]
MTASRRRSWVSSRATPARCSAVRSRRIFKKPRWARSPSRSGIISPEAQKRRPSLRRCQRSSDARPSCSARCISCSMQPLARSSGVKKRVASWPCISAAVQPITCTAPGFQSVMRPAGSVITMAKSTADSKIARWRDSLRARAARLAPSSATRSCEAVRSAVARSIRRPCSRVAVRASAFAAWVRCSASTVSARLRASSERCWASRTVRRSVRCCALRPAALRAARRRRTSASRSSREREFNAAPVTRHGSDRPPFTRTVLCAQLKR